MKRQTTTNVRFRGAGKVLLWAGLAAVLLAGCAPGGETEGDGEGPMTITVGFFKADIEFFEGENDPVLAHIEERFNVDFELKPVTWSNFRERYNLWATSGELPDYFAHAITSTRQYNEWVDQGVVKALPEDLSAYPNIEAILDNPKYETFLRDGRHYMIPRENDSPSGAGAAAQYGMLIRTDWLENMGLDMPTNHEEFVEVLRAFTYGDPDGNGEDDTVGVIPREPNWGTQTITFPFYPVGSHGVYWDYIDGQWFPSAYSDKNLPGLIALNEIHQEGLIDTDYVSMQSTQEPVDRFTQGRAGILLTQPLPNAVEIIHNTWKKFNPDVDMFEVTAFIRDYPWPAPDGNRYHMNTIGFWAENFFAGTVSDAKQARILEIADYLLSDEGQMYTLYGIEGETYAREEGEVVDLREVEDGVPVALERTYPSVSYFSRMVNWGMETLPWDHPSWWSATGRRS